VAFAYCTGLTEIHCKNPIPPNIHFEAFLFVDLSTCILYVPKGSYDTYRNALCWREFVNIIEEDETAITPINKENISIHPSPNGISVDTQEATSISIYNISGQKVHQSTIYGNTEIHLNTGIYIVKMNNKSQKIFIK
jgi:hypothetical protein